MPSIVLKHKEVPNLITKLYKAVNTPERCVVDKLKPADFVVVNTKNEKLVSIHKLCRRHEIKRRLLQRRKPSTRR